ncbi:radical SAM protein [Calditrichota bacterium LG25]
MIMDKNIYRTSKAVVIKNIGNNKYAVWNRYFPEVVFLNNDGIKFLKYMEKNKKPYKDLKGFKRIIKNMVSNKLLYSISVGDSFKNDFWSGGELNLKKINDNMKKQYEEKLPFSEFTIINQKCNLACPYCIVNYIKNKNIRYSKKKKNEKITKLLSCIDQFFIIPQNKKKIKGRRINFNGGEILLDWPIVKSVVNYVNKKYKDEDIEFNINTNGTLISEEIASFLAINNFKHISISIDGYKEYHNKTRKYHNGNGSFDDVIKAKKILDKNLLHPIDSYQGTLINKYEFEIDKLFEMKEYGFERARLGINLLGIKEEDAKKMAKLHFKMAIKTIENKWRAMDSYFDIYESILSSTKKEFNFQCMGLSNLSGKVIYYNIDSDLINTLCSFATGVQVKLDEIDYNIYHPLIFEKGFIFLTRRFEKIKEVCKDCEIVGICRGGCVMTGIDSYNKKNEAACVFQKETWKYFLTYIYSRNN